jgi:hypothetical protein
MCAKEPALSSVKDLLSFPDLGFYHYYHEIEQQVLRAFGAQSLP